MDKKKFMTSGLLELYVLGLAAPEEINKVEKYARKFEEIQKLIKKLQDSITSYARSKSINAPRNP